MSVFQRCLYFAIKITINRHTVYRECFNFSHNVLIRRSQFKSKLLLKAQVLHFLFHSKTKGMRMVTSEIFPVLEFNQKLEKLMIA